MLTYETVLLVVVTFLVAGTIKGAVGLGLPIVALVFMAVPLGIKPAIAIILVPGIFTNIWQAFYGPALGALVKRLWSFLLCTFIGVWLGVAILSSLEQDTILTALGIILALYSAFSLLTPQIKPPGKYEVIASPAAGGLGGVAFGATGIFIIPGVVYLQALGLKKDELVQALGLAFITLNLSILGAFLERGFINRDITILSFVALLPTWAGIYLGQKFRSRISEQLFRTVFFCTLLAVSFYFIFVRLD